MILQLSLDYLHQLIKELQEKIESLLKKCACEEKPEDKEKEI